MKPASFGHGFVIRLWNSDVDPVQAQLYLPKMTRNGALGICDLLERKKRKIKTTPQGEAKVKLKPNEMVTLLWQQK